MVYTEVIRAIDLLYLRRFVLAAQYFGFGYVPAFRLFLMSKNPAIPPSNRRLRNWAKKQAEDLRICAACTLIHS
jgi:hypothetical protein